VSSYVDYYAYIKSEAWQRKRRKFYSSSLYKTYTKEGKWVCYCCGANESLDLHHRTYKRLGKENISTDLIPVCRGCHEKIHELEKSGMQLWSATKRVRRNKNRKKK
jgi:predicted HNH restriction endonuclease